MTEILDSSDAFQKSTDVADKNGFRKLGRIPHIVLESREPAVTTVGEDNGPESERKVS